MKRLCAPPDWVGLLMAGVVILGGMLAGWVWLRPGADPLAGPASPSDRVATSAVASPPTPSTPATTSAVESLVQAAPSTQALTAAPTWSSTPGPTTRATPSGAPSRTARPTSSTAKPTPAPTTRPAARAKDCQDLITTVRPSYAPSTGWTIACVRQIPASVRKQTGWTIDEVTGWTDFSTHRINIIDSGRVAQMRQAIAHEWAHAESASWGLQESKFTAYWVKLLGYTPATAQEFWSEKRDYEDQPAERWAESRSRCAGYTYGQPVSRLATCNTVAKMLEYMANAG